MTEKTGGQHKVHRFFVDGKEYQSAHQTITGAQLRAMAVIDPGIGIFLEEPGQDKPDLMIADTASINLGKPGVKKFYTVPPATFGGF